MSMPGVFGGFDTANLGTTVGSKMDVFLEKFRRGGAGGSFPIQKITLQILLVSKRYILERKKRNVISKKGGEGGGSSPIQKISLQIYAYLTDFLEKSTMYFLKKDEGGVKAVWKFSKKT